MKLIEVKTPKAILLLTEDEYRAPPYFAYFAYQGLLAAPP